jgi:integrase
MSSIVTSSSGLRRIEVIVGGKRYKLRLGRMPVRNVEAFRVRVDALAEARALRRRDAEAEKWCDAMDVRLRHKLISIGLLPRRDDETLAGLIERFYNSRDHIKSSTRAADRQATDSLLEFFGDNTLIQTITAIEAEEWRQKMVKSGLAEATIAKRIIKARAVFARAVKPWKLLTENPLGDLRTGSQKNEARLRFITPEMSQAVMAACPDAEWRAIFALARWGGLRMPSEIERLEWQDIVWDRHRMRIASPKTAHHEGKAERWCPLFPEVSQALVELFDNTPSGTVHIFAVKRRTATNLRTSMMKIVLRAGLAPWPRLFQNLRSSRETELCERFPEHLVCQWLGNSPQVARRHYLQMLDHYFEQAAQKAAQPTHDKGRQAIPEDGENREKTADNAACDMPSGRYRANNVRDSLRKLLISEGCGAKSGALADSIIELLARA